MEICRIIAGYSYGRADIVRRAMAKKKHDVMKKERSIFIFGNKDEDSGECCGAIANGVSEKIANEIFDEMSGFASYAFNKSHAAAYAYLSYQTAYLKCHYTKEYMAALMSSVLGNIDKLYEYVEECRKYDIEILRPDINRSFSEFTAEEAGIRYGLLAIKSIGKGIILNIIDERAKNGHFTSLENFCERMAETNISRIIVENLIKSGCFDNLGQTRREMVSEYEYLMDRYSDFSRRNIEGQMNLFPDNSTPVVSKIKPKNIPEYKYADILEFEKLATGMYISGHPLKEYELIGKLMKFPVISDIKKNADKYKNVELKFIGVLDDVSIHYTSTGKKMAFLDVQDVIGTISCTVFPETYELYNSKLEYGKIIYIYGKISQKDNYDYSVLCNHIYSEEEFRNIYNAKRLCIKILTSQKETASKITEIANKYSGENQLCFFLADTHKFIKPKTVSGVRICPEFIAEIENFVSLENIGLID